MQSKTFRRDSGVVLLASLMVVMTLFGTIMLILNFSMSESEVLEDRAGEVSAFYLAEGALQAAKWEILENVDSDGDGLGTLPATTTSAGSFVVTAVETDGVYQLTAEGTGSDGSVITLVSTVKVSYETNFPIAAVSMVGNFSNFKWEWDDDNKNSLILDGGPSAAMSFSSLSNYNYWGNKFAKALDGGKTASSSLTGGVTNDFIYDGTTYTLPLAYDTSPDTQLANLSTLYTELDTKATAAASTDLPIPPMP